MEKRYGRKDELDRFYTNRDIAKQCVSFFDLSQYELIIEPSAGDGAFIDAISKPIYAIDINPNRDDIIQKDFFEFETKIHSSKVLIIGNPPFGKQNNLALKFINHAAKYADTIGFILPASFMKPSIQNRIDLKMNLDYCLELPINSFLFNDKIYDVPAVFQIWKKGKIRQIQKPDKPINFEYTTQELGNMSIRRVGHYAGKASKDINKNKQSHFFVRIHDVNKIDFVVKGINDVVWTHKNTVGPRTVSKFELTPIINVLLLTK